MATLEHDITSPPTKSVGSTLHDITHGAPGARRWQYPRATGQVFDAVVDKGAFVARESLRESKSAVGHLTDGDYEEVSRFDATFEMNDRTVDAATRCNTARSTSAPIPPSGGV